jgi:hypothetical protein
MDFPTGDSKPTTRRGGFQLFSALENVAFFVDYLSRNR